MPRTALLGIALVLMALAGTAAGQPKSASLSKSSDTSDADALRVNGKTLTEWKLQLKSEDPSKRTLAIAAIAQFGESTTEIVHLLLDRTRDRDMSPRLRAIQALRTIPVDDKDVPKVVQDLGRLLYPTNEPQIAVRYEAAWALQRFYDDAAPATAALIQGSRDSGSWEIRYRCVQLLWRVGAMNRSGPEDRVVEALIACLYDNAAQVKLEAVMGLAALGKPGNPAVTNKVLSVLDTASRSSNKVFALWAYAGLVTMNDKVAETNLVAMSRFLKNPDTEIRAQAALALGSLGPKAKSRIPNLVALLDDKDSVVAQGACTSLAQIGEKDSKVLDALVEVLDHKDPGRVYSAAMALAQVAPGNTRVEAAIQKQLDRKDKEFDALRPLLRSALEQVKKPPKK